MNGNKWKFIFLLIRSRSYNLSIRFSFSSTIIYTLNPIKKERQIMEDHVSLTYELLDKLPYPKHLNNVPFYDGCHHEKINGEGYPNGYSGDELPIQARIIALADVFEGLTAPDRPYKDGYPLSKAMNILRFMTLDNELDKDIFNLFINQKVYLKYAEENIKDSQIDKINEKDLLV